MAAETGPWLGDRTLNRVQSGVSVVTLRESLRLGPRTMGVMQPQQAMGQMLLLAGAMLLIVGAFFYFGGNLGPLGRLPGDIRLEGKSGGFYFPIMTSLLLSVLLTILFNLWLGMRNR